MKFNSYLMILAVIALSCGQQKQNEKDSAVESDSAFSNYKEGLILRFWQVYPTWASSVGFHKYDDRLNVPDAAQRASELSFLNAEMDSLKKFNPQQLNGNNRTDYYLIENQLK